jgi:putative ABC transport system ATP-binding protein
MILAENLEKVYEDNGVKTPALRGISFQIKKGEFVAIMGPSGSGKSSLLHILGFLDRPTGGTYLFNNKSINDLSDDELAKIRNEEMGFIFQDFNLLNKATVFENVELPLLYSSLSPQKRDEIIRNIVKSVGLEEKLYVEAGKLSGGQKQRVAIARALVNNPLVIFADEPTGNLDSKSGAQIMHILKSLHQKGHTIVLVTHETYTAEFAERLIRLKDGLLEEDKKIEKRRDVDEFFK